MTLNRRLSAIKIVFHVERKTVFQIDVNNDGVTNHSDGLHYHHVGAGEPAGEDISCVTQLLSLTMQWWCRS